jgi:hypothetical protein
LSEGHESVALSESGSLGSGETQVARLADHRPRLRVRAGVRDDAAASLLVSDRSGQRSCHAARWALLLSAHQGFGGCPAATLFTRKRARVLILAVEVDPERRVHGVEGPDA